MKNNNRLHKHNKQQNKLISITSIILFIIVFCLSACVAGAETIDEYNAQIQENNEKIQAMDEIKTQLHITAELLRSSSYINNGFDEVLGQKWHNCTTYQENLLNQNNDIQSKINFIKAEQLKAEQEKNSKKYVGNFKITHYCPCNICNGSWGSKTALGTTMTPYRTIAVDPRIIPLGSKVEIQGKTYIAEDTGGAIKGNRIDMCVSSHSEAYRRGVLNSVPVYIVK